jgi:hypothetical protein
MEHRRPRCMVEGSIKIDLGETGWCVMEDINLAEDRD